MLSAYLYHINRNKLQPLTHEELLARYPENPGSTEALEPGESTLRGEADARREEELIWLEACAPQNQDYEILRARFGLSARLIERLKERDERPRIYDYGAYSHLILYAVVAASQERIDFSFQKIDCVVGTDFILTVHGASPSPFEELKTRWEAHPELMKDGTQPLLYEIFDSVLDGYFPVLEAFDDRIDHIEERLFESERGYNRKMTAEIFALKRDLSQLRHIAGPMRDVIGALMRRDGEMGRKYFPYFQALFDHATRIIEMADTFRDILGSALDAFLAAESNRMNAVMKTLTSASIILLIPNLIAAIYGMNFDHMPELHMRYGYPVVLGVMLAIMLALYLNFKRKDWL